MKYDQKNVDGRNDSKCIRRLGTVKDNLELKTHSQASQQYNT